MSISAISNPGLYQRLTTSTASGYAPATSSGAAILPVDDFYSGVPQSINNAMGQYILTTQADWNVLGKSLDSGDDAAAQTAFENYNQSLADSNLSMSSLTTPSEKFQNYLTQIGDAISSGDLSKAKSVYGTAQWYQPTSVVMAMGEAVDTAAIDGAKTAYWMQDLINFAGTLSPATSYTAAAGSASSSSQSADDLFARDLSAVEAVVHEGDSNFGDFLLSQGYSSSDVSSIVNVLDYTRTVSLLSSVTSDIAYITNNTDTFTVTSSIGNIHTSGGSASAVVNSSTNTFQGASTIGSSSVTGAQAQGSSTSASVSGVSDAFYYSFSIAETHNDGTSTNDSASGSAYLSGGSTTDTASSLATESNAKYMLQLVEELCKVTTAQTASDVKDITSSPIVPLAVGANPDTSPYYGMMAKSAVASMSEVQNVLAEVLGSPAATATATSSMTGYDGKYWATSSVSVYA